MAPLPLRPFTATCPPGIPSFRASPPIALQFGVVNGTLCKGSFFFFEKKEEESVYEIGMILNRFRERFFNLKRKKNKLMVYFSILKQVCGCLFIQV